MDATTLKLQLRRQIRQALAGIPPDAVREASAAACQVMRQQELWRAGKSVLFYAAMPGELDPSPLLTEALAEGKTAALPGFVAADNAYEAFVVRHATDDCAPGKFGIAEPGAHCERLVLNRLDLILVPGVGFDSTGHRLGRGRGFYDRLLAKTTAIKCGVAFDSQVMDLIPAEAHDIRMDCLLTPTRWRQLL